MVVWSVVFWIFWSESVRSVMVFVWGSRIIKVVISVFMGVGLDYYG